MSLIVNHMLSFLIVVMVLLALAHAVGFKGRVLIACALCVISVVIFYVYVYASKNTLKTYVANNKKSIIYAMKQDVIPPHHDALLCAGMLNQQSQIKPSNQTRLKAAECFEGMKLVSASNQIIDYVLKHDPKSDVALYLKTRANLTEYGIDSLEFVNHLHTLLKTNPNHIDGLWLLAALEYYRCENSSALVTLDKLEKLIHQKDDSENNQMKKDKLNKLKQFRITIEQAVQS